MNLTVKTLKGGKFTVEVEPTNTVAEVKTAIVSYRIIFFFKARFFPVRMWSFLFDALLCHAIFVCHHEFLGGSKVRITSRGHETYPFGQSVEG